MNGAAMTIRPRQIVPRQIVRRQVASALIAGADVLRRDTVLVVRKQRALLGKHRTYVCQLLDAADRTRADDRETIAMGVRTQKLELIKD
jgi:hypothetical protein